MGTLFEAIAETQFDKVVFAVPPANLEGHIMVWFTRLETVQAVRRDRSGKCLRRGRKADLALESLEPRLPLAANPFTSLVSITDAEGTSLITGRNSIVEGDTLVALVQLTRKPAAAVRVAIQSGDSLQVSASLPSLRFTRANWDQPQAVTFTAVQDGSADGNKIVPVAMRVSLPSRPWHGKAAKSLQFESVDSGLQIGMEAARGKYTGRITGEGGVGNVAAVNHAGGKGKAIFTVTLPNLKNVTNRVIQASYVIGTDNSVQVTSVSGIAPKNFQWNARYQSGPDGAGLSGTLTVLQPKLHRASTVLVSATLQTPPVCPAPIDVTGLSVHATAADTLTVNWLPTASSRHVSYFISVNGGSSRSTDGLSTKFTGLDLTKSYTFTVTAFTPVSVGAGSKASWALESPYNLVAVKCVGLDILYQNYLTTAFPAGPPANLAVSFILRLQYNRVLTGNEFNPVLSSINSQTGLSIAKPLFNQTITNSGPDGAGFDINSTYINISYTASSRPEELLLNIPADIVFLEWQINSNHNFTYQPTFSTGENFNFLNNDGTLIAAYPLERGNPSLKELGLLIGQAPTNTSAFVYSFTEDFKQNASVYKIDAATSSSASLSGSKDEYGCSISYVLGGTATTYLQDAVSPYGPTYGTTLEMNGIPSNNLLEPYNLIQVKIDKQLLDGVFNPYNDDTVSADGTANYISIGFHTAGSGTLPNGTDYTPSTTTLRYGVSAVDVVQLGGDDSFYYVYFTTSQSLYEEAMLQSGYSLDSLSSFAPVVSPAGTLQKGYLLYNKNSSDVQGGMLLRIRNGNYDTPDLQSFYSAQGYPTVDANEPYPASWIEIVGDVRS